MKKLMVALVAVAMTAAAAFAETYTWKGGSGSFSEAANWTSTSGGVPDENADLVFPAGDNTVTDVGTLTVNTIVLNGNTELKFGSAGGTFTVNGVISGAGSLTSTGNPAANSIIDLKGANTFTGDYWNNGGRTVIRTNTALGVGNAAYFRDNGKPATPLYFARHDNVDRVIANNLYLGRDVYGYFMSVNSVAAKVRLTGTVTFSNTGKCASLVASDWSTRTYDSATGTGVLSLEGPVVSEDRDKASNVSRIIFRTWTCMDLKGQITGAPMSFEMTVGNRLDVYSQNNSVSEVVWNGDNNSTLNIYVDDPFVNPINCYVRNTTWGTRAINLHGHNLNVKNLYNGTAAPLDLQTDAPATITIIGDTADHVLANNSKVTGPVSLVYDSADHIYSFNSDLSAMTGKLAAKAGTLAVGGDAKKVTAVEADSGATVQLNGAMGKFSLNIGKDGDVYGKLKLNGQNLECTAVTVGGEAQEKDAVFTAANCDWIEGEGSVKVLYAPTDYIWTGASSTSWTDAGNWLKGGTTPAASPSGECSIVFGGDVNITDLPAVEVGDMVLNGAVKLAFSDAGGTFTVNGVISGPGSLEMVGNSKADCYTALKGNNTFEGGYINRGGCTYLYHNNCLGAGKALFSTNGKPGSTFFAKASVVIPNDIDLGYAYNFFGPVGADSGKTIKFSGKVRLTSDAVVGTQWGELYRMSADVTFSGELEFAWDKIGDSGLLTGNTLAIGCPITGYYKPIRHNAAWCVCFINSSGNHISALAFSAIGTQYRLMANNVFDLAQPGSFKFCNPDAAPMGAGECSVTIDQNLVQTVDSVYDDKTYAVNAGRVVTGGANTVLTIRQSAASRKFGGTFNNHLSLVYDPTSSANVYTLQNTQNSSTSTTDGSLTVKGGELIIGQNIAFPNLQAITIANAAKLSIYSDAGTVAAGSLTVEEGGTLYLGKDITVPYAAANGQALPVGEYSAGEDNPWLAGTGKLTVTKSLAGRTVWTGALDGDFAKAGNWLVNGVVPAAAPLTGDSIELDAEMATRPMVFEGTNQLTGTIYLNEGVHQLTFGTNALLTLTGKITGPGGLNLADKSASCLYMVDFCNGENDFAGGVTRSGTGTIRVSTDDVLGTGLVTLGVTEGSSRSPLTVMENCTLSNEFRVAHESFTSWNGWLTSPKAVEVHFTGRVSFNKGSDQTRFNTTSGTKVHFDGEVCLGMGLILKSGVEVFFNTAIQPCDGQKGALWTDNGSATCHITQPTNQLAGIYTWDGGYGSQWKIYLETENAIPGVNVYHGYVGSQPPAGNGFQFYLQGNSQSIGNLYFDAQAVSKGKMFVDSDEPATLTVHNTANRTYDGRFTGKVSLVYEPTDDFTYTLTKAFETEGSLTVKGGTVKLANANVLTRKNDVVLNGGKLQLDGDQTIRNLTLGMGNPVEPGRYVSMDYSGEEPGVIKLEQLTGDGVLTVRGNPGLVILIW